MIQNMFSDVFHSIWVSVDRIPYNTPYNVFYNVSQFWAIRINTENGEGYCPFANSHEISVNTVSVPVLFTYRVNIFYTLQQLIFDFLFDCGKSLHYH